MLPQAPIQPVDQPVICSPYNEPMNHYVSDGKGGWVLAAGRRPAGYWYKTERVAGKAKQREMWEDRAENRDDLVLVNAIREDVRRWRESGWRGATSVTRDLLRHWSSKERSRRLFFCQLEAVETVIYLAEIRIPGREGRTGYRSFALPQADLERLLAGINGPFEALKLAEGTAWYPTLADQPANGEWMPLRRLGCKMATGAGKTVVMAMLIGWGMCNRGLSPNSREFPAAFMVCCPNKTVKERLQVLRPEVESNYFTEFDIVPAHYRHLLKPGRVLVENWHQLTPPSEHSEGGKSYSVVNKGEITPEAFARTILGDSYGFMPVMVLNDEGHHCWRPRADDADGAEDGEDDGPLKGEERKLAEEEARLARVWLDGLDRINNALPVGPDGVRKPGVLMCVDLSATPFYLKGSGYPEGQPFPWLVSDFGLVDAIESGITKIPRLPVLDTTGRPDPKYYRLWENVRTEMSAGLRRSIEMSKAKPEAIYKKAEGALIQIAGQWAQRFELTKLARPGQDVVPPVMILVCGTSALADYFYTKISGETEEEIATLEDVEALEDDAEGDDDAPKAAAKKSKKPKKRITYGRSTVHPELANTATSTHTIRIYSDIDLTGNGGGKADEEMERLRKIVSTVGKRGQPGEKVRCVVSVMMLTEGWDANNVTQIFGLRAFGSQLLCEQVVGRGLRRMDYTPDPKTGLLSPEYVDVYGIPFSLLPFKGRPDKAKAPEDKPLNNVQAMEERADLKIEFPRVDRYAFVLRKDAIRCDVEKMEELLLEPDREPIQTWLQPVRGFSETGAPVDPGRGYVAQDRQEYYQRHHIQSIQFEITRRVVERLVTLDGSTPKGRLMRLQSRHRLFPQVLQFVRKYLEEKVRTRGCTVQEVGLERYAEKVISNLATAIMPDESQGEQPLVAILEPLSPHGSTENVHFRTTKPCYPTRHSHVNMVVADTNTWEQSGAAHIERCAEQGIVRSYVKNEGLGLVIPYEYEDSAHNYEPDYVVVFRDSEADEPDGANPSAGVRLIVEIKGEEDNRDRAKYEGAKRWCTGVNNLGTYGRWAFHVCRDPHMLAKELDSYWRTGKADAWTVGVGR